jgi:hypothetical protein
MRPSRNEDRHVTTQKAKPQTIASSLGMIALGITLFIVGTILKSHFQTNAVLCNTFGDSSAQCTGNEGAFSFGQVLQPLGGFMFAAGVIIGVIVLIENNTKRGEDLTRSPSSAHGPQQKRRLDATPHPNSRVVQPSREIQEVPERVHDPVYTTIAAVEAVAGGDSTAIRQSAIELNSISAHEVFAALGDTFGTIS